MTVSQRLDAVIDRALADEAIVGTNVILMQDGEVVYARAAGLMDREAAKPMRPGTVFRFASVSKPIVSVAALALVERGLLSLDDPVTRFLPDFRPRLPDGTAPDIRIRHLLSHTAGLTYDLSLGGDPAERPSGGLDGSRISMAENLKRIGRLPLLFAPGTGWSYSIAIDVIGGILEIAAGKRLQEIVAETVTGPLGMVDTGFLARDPERLATVYGGGRPPRRVGEPDRVDMLDGTSVFLSPARAFDPDVFPSGGAGMVGTAEDVVHFLDAMRRGGAPVLTAKSWPCLTENVTGTWDTGVPGRGFALAWSILWDPAAQGSAASRGTWGWGGVYGHQWWVDLEKRRTLVSFTNCVVEGCKGQYPDTIRDAGLSP